MESNTSQPNNSGASAFLPVLLVSLSVLIFVSWQFRLVWKQQAGLKEVQKSRETLVKQSQAVQNDLQKLAVGLLELAKTDPEASALVQKYGIAQTQPPK
ncbi:MAG TPA: hypothetical protein VI454_00030 [Verrucomicrobiae bacterium]|jgi:hypothetical protein